MTAEAWLPVVGQRFTSWTVIEIAMGEMAKQVRHRKILCRCTCGREDFVSWSNLRYGLSTGCRACPMRRTMTKHAATSGGTEQRVYREWKAMKWRCSPRNKRRADYFDRGISVCEEWAVSFPAFRDWATANGYEDHLTLDRVDNDGNYGPENCRWATRVQQARNKRTNRLLTVWGETKSIAEWAEDPRCEVSRYTIATRLWMGWGEAESVTTPPQRRSALAMGDSRRRP